MAEQGLKDKTVKGVGWSAIDNVSQHAVSFLVSIILARLLSPDDYGLIGLIIIFTDICTSLINGGFANALIRKKDVTADDYSTVFIVNLGMSLLLYGIIYICSPLIAAFFARNELVALTRVTSLGMIIGAFAIVQQTRLTKKIDFKTQTKITLIAAVTSGVVGIVMALMGLGVWSLVAQGLSNLSLRTIFLWIYARWKPSVHFSKKSFCELFGFGWKIMLSNLLDTVWKELYQVVVGKFYSPATLGQYSRAKGFSQLFSNNLTSVIQRVTYPVLSDIQDDTTRMVNAYRRIIKISMFITAASMLFLGAISEPLLYCLIGPKWHEAATYLPLICIAGSLYPLQAINLNMLQVQGRSDLYLVLEIIKKVLGLVPLFVGAFVSIMAMLYVNLGIVIICYFLNSFFSGRHLGYSSLMQIKDTAPSYGIATVVSLVVWAIKYLPVSNWVILPIQLITGVALFVIICQLLKLEEYSETIKILHPLISKLRYKNKR